MTVVVVDSVSMVKNQDQRLSTPDGALSTLGALVRENAFIDQPFFEVNSREGTVLGENLGQIELLPEMLSALYQLAGFHSPIPTGCGESEPPSAFSKTMAVVVERLNSVPVVDVTPAFFEAMSFRVVADRRLRTAGRFYDLIVALSCTEKAQNLVLHRTGAIRRLLRVFQAVRVMGDRAPRASEFSRDSPVRLALLKKSDDLISHCPTVS